MLAKNYKYPYEAILSVEDVVNTAIGQRGCPYLVKKGYYYPLYNTERIIDSVNKVKDSIEKELEEKIDLSQLKKEEEIIRFIIQRWRALVPQELNNIYVRLMLETGYKEELRCVCENEGMFKLDLGSIIRVNNSQSSTITDKITVNNKTYQIQALAKEALIFSFVLR